ncbi:probable peptide chain release factor C12orf65, mitochondrial isoform X2 [Cryptotermes secundus]|nr:probable peptide chain release factor C12orf65, mitochondrial isoform X2 [Cryptotermes secundus]
MSMLARIYFQQQPSFLLHLSSVKINVSECINISVRNKHKLDYSRVPKLKEEDLDEQFVRGTGPGGQAVNKTNNCVVLVHKPTGIAVKCHKSRLQEENRKLARNTLITKLDNFLNGELSIEAQERAVMIKKSKEKSRRQQKLAELKAKWKEKEGLT